MPSKRMVKEEDVKIFDEVGRSPRRNSSTSSPSLRLPANAMHLVESQTDELFTDLRSCKMDAADSQTPNHNPPVLDSQESLADEEDGGGDSSVSSPPSSPLFILKRQFSLPVELCAQQNEFTFDDHSDDLVLNIGPGGSGVVNTTDRLLFPAGNRNSVYSLIDELSTLPPIYEVEGESSDVTELITPPPRSVLFWSEDSLNEESFPGNAKDVFPKIHSDYHSKNDSIMSYYSVPTNGLKQGTDKSSPGGGAEATRRSSLPAVLPSELSSKSSFQPSAQLFSYPHPGLAHNPEFEVFFSRANVSSLPLMLSNKQNSQLLPQLRKINVSPF